MSGELLQPKAEDGSLLPEEETPQQRAARGEAFTLRFYLDTQEGDRRMLEATSQPVGLDEQRASVVVVRDVTKH
jgi:two-component system CheB/CheR fusion protein